MYVKIDTSGDVMFVYLYTYDLIFSGSNTKMFDEFKKKIAQEFERTDLMLITYYLVIEVKQENECIFHFLKKITLKKF